MWGETQGPGCLGGGGADGERSEPVVSWCRDDPGDPPPPPHFLLGTIGTVISLPRERSPPHQPGQAMRVATSAAREGDRRRSRGLCDSLPVHSTQREQCSPSGK